MIKEETPTSIAHNEARQLLRKEKEQLQDSIKALIEEYEIKTGLKVLEMKVIRAAGYGGMSDQIIGVDPKIEL